MQYSDIYDNLAINFKPLETSIHPNWRETEAFLLLFGSCAIFFNLYSYFNYFVYITCNSLLLRFFETPKNWKPLNFTSKEDHRRANPGPQKTAQPVSRINNIMLWWYPLPPPLTMVCFKRCVRCKYSSKKRSKLSMETPVVRYRLPEGRTKRWDIGNSGKS